MIASLLLSALQVLKVDLNTDEEDALVWNSESVSLSPVFLSLLKSHIYDLKGLLKLRCKKCQRVSICEEGESYFLAYCPNGHGFIRNEAKAGFTQDDAGAEYEQICFEAEERLALMTEHKRNEKGELPDQHYENVVLNELCSEIVIDLFTERKRYEQDN